MMKPLTIDLEYLCGKMTDMSSLPIRIYEISELKSRFSVVPFVADPADSCLKELLSRRENVSYYLNERSEYYGVVVHEDTTIIIGPVFDSPPTSRQIHNLAFELGVSNRDYEAFAGFISAIAPMPLESVIQMMCSINHILSGEKL
ncbi:MAG: hypothetical protein J5694_03735, partial [Erysipelotrichaceae bacterium]|nr:hypothetical protein [Erysipelotrichaceae bacterium]